MLHKALPLSLLILGSLTMASAQAEETQPVAQIAKSDAASKLGRFNPVFASHHKGCPMHGDEDKAFEAEGKPCPYHDAEHGEMHEHFEQEMHK